MQSQEPALKKAIASLREGIETIFCRTMAISLQNSSGQEAEEKINKLPEVLRERTRRIYIAERLENGFKTIQQAKEGLAQLELPEAMQSAAERIIATGPETVMNIVNKAISKAVEGDKERVEAASTRFIEISNKGPKQVLEKGVPYLNEQVTSLVSDYLKKGKLSYSELNDLLPPHLSKEEKISLHRQNMARQIGGDNLEGIDSEIVAELVGNYVQKDKLSYRELDDLLPSELSKKDKISLHRQNLARQLEGAGLESPDKIAELVGNYIKNENLSYRELSDTVLPELSTEDQANLQLKYLAQQVGENNLEQADPNKVIEEFIKRKPAGFYYKDLDNFLNNSSFLTNEQKEEHRLNYLRVKGLPDNYQELYPSFSKFLQSPPSRPSKFNYDELSGVLKNFAADDLPQEKKDENKKLLTGLYVKEQLEFIDDDKERQRLVEAFIQDNLQSLTYQDINNLLAEMPAISQQEKEKLQNFTNIDREKYAEALEFLKKHAADPKNPIFESLEISLYAAIRTKNLEFFIEEYQNLQKQEQELQQAGKELEQRDLGQLEQQPKAAEQDIENIMKKPFRESIEGLLYQDKDLDEGPGKQNPLERAYLSQEIPEEVKPGIMTKLLRALWATALKSASWLKELAQALVQEVTGLFAQTEAPEQRGADKARETFVLKKADIVGKKRSAEVKQAGQPEVEKSKEIEVAQPPKPEKKDLNAQQGKVNPSEILKKDEQKWEDRIKSQKVAGKEGVGSGRGL